MTPETAKEIHTKNYTTVTGLLLIPRHKRTPAQKARISNFFKALEVLNNAVLAEGPAFIE